MDFLGLRTLTVIKDAIDLIKQNYNIDIVFTDDMSDPAVFKLISEGKTDGVFQLESAGMKEFLRELKPQSLEDIIAGISLYRPGPMDQIPRYIKNKNSQGNIQYLHPALEPILNVTYGCMVYQEQVMQIVRELAGYSFGHADLVRRAMAKKKADVMAKERENFIAGCKERNIDEVSANKIYDEMIDFAKYAFNKSHAAAYAVVAYRTAYLKAHYPAEFMAAMLNSFIGSLDKVPQYIAECKKLGIKILGPNINESYTLFTVKDNAIRFGLAAVKNIGEEAVDAIVLERNANGKFTDFEDFCKRISGKKVNKKCIESLIKCGAFDGMHYRSVLLESYEKIIDGISQSEKNNIEGQFNLFDIGKATNNVSAKFNYPVINEFSQKELLMMEKEMLGLYISGHPLDKFRDIAEKRSNITSQDVVEYIENVDNDNFESKVRDEMEVSICGIISNKKTKITRNNETMAFFKIEDLYGTIDAIVFPKTYSRLQNSIKEDIPVIIKGRLSLREDEEPKIICNSIEEINLVPSKLYLKIETDKENIVDSTILPILSKNHGDTSVMLYYSKDKITKVAPKEYNVNVSDEMLKELSGVLGEENVKCVY